MKSIIYLKTFRRKWGLSQRELAQLLGHNGERTRGRIYLYENGLVQPSLNTALAFEVIFGETPSSTFPSRYDSIEGVVMARAAKLYARLEEKTDKKSLRKLELLRSMIKRSNTSEL